MTKLRAYRFKDVWIVDLRHYEPLYTTFYQSRKYAFCTWNEALRFISSV